MIQQVQPQQSMQLARPAAGLGAPRATPGLGFEMPTTAQAWLITGGLGLLGGLAGYYLWKKHRYVGAGIGAIAGLAAVPVVANAIGGAAKG